MDNKTEEVNNNTVEEEVFVINTGKTKGTTFKIKVKDLAFSSLFDTGAQVSCIKYDTVSEMELLHEFQNKFPNLYVEPMQYNNPNGKWSENIPYMIINLEHERDIYLGKDTVMAYAREEDKSCDYLEINEIIQMTDLKKNLSTKSRSIIESDLVFSPAQVTEH